MFTSDRKCVWRHCFDVERPPAPGTTEYPEDNVTGTGNSGDGSRHIEWFFVFAGSPLTLGRRRQ